MRAPEMLTLCAALAFLSGVRAIWEEPLVRAQLRVWSSATGTQQPGTVITHTCNATGVLVTQTLYWRHQKGNTLWDPYVRGRSELVWERAAESSDANTALVCDVQYTSPRASDGESGFLQSYHVTSAPLQLHVASGIPTTPTPIVASQSLTLSHNGTSNTLQVGDWLQFTCRPTNFVSLFFDTFIVKDGLEMQLHHTAAVTVTSEDDGTEFYCRSWLTGYILISNRIRITVLP